MAREYKTVGQIEDARRFAAEQALIKAGGPRALARLLSAHLGAAVDEKRVAKWRKIGVPVRWGVIVEHVTGVKREKLNPYEYTVDAQVIHRKLSKDYLLKSIAFRRTE